MSPRKKRTAKATGRTRKARTVRKTRGTRGTRAAAPVVREAPGPVAAAERRVAEARGLTVGQVQLLESRRGMSQQVLRTVPESVVKRAIRRLDYPDMPRAREAFRLLQSKDEHGTVAANALPNAIRQLDSVRA